jgi:hypothetical protein
VAKRVGSFAAAIVELLRNNLTDEQAAAVLASLEQCFISFPSVSVTLLQSETLAHSPHGFGGPSTAAQSLMQAIVEGYMGLESCRRPLLGCKRENVLPWIQALQAGVVDAACLGLAIYSTGASEEDITFLAAHLSSGSPTPVDLLAKAAVSCLDARGRGIETSSRHPSVAALVILERFAGSAGLHPWSCVECFVPCCVALMKDGDDVMALLAAHTFAKCVEAKGEDAASFLDRSQCVPALVSVVGRSSWRCKKAGALAIYALARHLGEDAVIPMLFKPYEESCDGASEPDLAGLGASEPDPAGSGASEPDPAGSRASGPDAQCSK